MGEDYPRLWRRSGWWFAIMLIVGIALRLLMVLRGNNVDLETLMEIARSPWGTNFYRRFPYAANWGPILYWVFQGVYRLPGGHEIATFHLYLAILYSICDVISAWVLRRIFGLAAAAIFLFMPAEMIISGYHCNAEPAVIACVMGAIYLVIPENAGKRTGWFYVLIGLSLGVKHAFAFFPIWLAMQPGSRSERLRALLI